MDLFARLKAERHDFRATVFAVPGLITTCFVRELPDWLELAVHGWLHQTVYECAVWTPDDIARVFDDTLVRGHFARVFKAPGWQISDACYEYCRDNDIVVADQRLAESRWPTGLKVYLHEDHPDRWHGHIQDIGTNGIEESWDALLAAVLAAQDFQFVSEVPPHVAP